MTPYWRSEDGRAVLYCGDAREVLRGMPEASVDAIVTDPPYNLSFMGKDWDRIDGEDAAFGMWLAGFVDGEGCFRVHKEKAGAYYACHFQIKLRADDRPLLERIRRFLGVGRIRDEAGSSGAAPQCALLVQAREDCARVRDVFLRYPLRGKKAEDFIEWCAALSEWERQERGNRWHGPADKTAMESHWRTLAELHRYRGHGVSTDPFQTWCTVWATEAMRVLKPGGHLLACGGPRTFHRLITGIEDAGFEIRDCLCWMFGSGFPKSRNLRGEWTGWGTALKPGWEPIALARKPLSEPNVAANVLRWGTGALNIDGCRIYTPGSEGRSYTVKRLKPGATLKKTGGSWRPSDNEHLPWEAGREFHGQTKDGRWPANVCLDEEAAALLDAQSGTSVSTLPGSFQRQKTSRGLRGGGFGQERASMREPTDLCKPGYGDSGGASRFFYCAKADRAERDLGLRGRGLRNDHPTVKPVDLMRWLIRLITPPRGVILDPFAGSGTTGVAAVREGFDCILIDQDAHYCDIAQARIDRELRQLRLPLEVAP